jgi:bifunctional lysine-specific demethylase and histidyl-hydroxylase MINA
MLEDAQLTVAKFLAPLTVEDFLGRLLTGGARKIAAGDATGRTEILGPDPGAVLMAAIQLAPKLTFHSANPSGPPPSLACIAHAADFQQRIEQLHARNYSVRFPELRYLWKPLDTLARAFEALLQQPVTTSAFWSRGGMKAPVHHDDHDLIVVQLRGTKRWYVSSGPSELPNTWENIPGGPPELGPHEVIDLRPGDVLYLPRGTCHTVDSDTESVHLAVGFTPLTVRQTLIAAIDHLSDFDRRWRMTVDGNLASQLRGAGMERLEAPAVEASAQLLAAVKTPGFLAAALKRRSSRVIGSLAALPVPPELPELSLDTVLVQPPHAFCYLTANAQKIDFSYPGGHIYIHRGAEESVVYIANTRRFKVREIPGNVGDDIRLSLAAQFLKIGFLEVESTVMFGSALSPSSRGPARPDR